jgi:hypothetical protein
MSFRRNILGLLTCSVCVGCASLAGVQERYAVCSYDQTWEASLAAVKDRSVAVKDKDKGLIQTAWLEIPMPGRKYGALRRDLGDQSKDRSRVAMTLTRMNDVTKVSFIEERERWAFRGGSRLFGWAPTEPSDEVMAEVRKRLDEKFAEQGCLAT